MGRPRKPTNVLEMSGAFRQHPERRRARAGEPVPTGSIGAAPRRLNASARAAWGEIVALSVPGVLANSDRVALELAAGLLAQFRSAPVAFPTTRLRSLLGLLGRFGLTPADRSRIGVPAIGALNPFGRV